MFYHKGLQREVRRGKKVNDMYVLRRPEGLYLPKNGSILKSKEASGIREGVLDLGNRNADLQIVGHFC